MTTEVKPPLRRPEPPLPPITDVEGTLALGQIMAHLGANPKHRRTILSMVREAAPTVPIPELDVQADIDARLTADAKAREDQAAALTKRLDAMEAKDRRKEFAEAHGLADDELVAVESFAKERGIVKPDTALEFYRREELGRPRQTGGIQSITAESRKLLFSNPREWAMREGAKVQQEMRRRHSGRGA